MAYQGRYNNGDRAKSGGGVWKIILIVILCVVLVLGLLFGAAYFYLDSKLNKVRQATFEEKDVSGQDLSALIGNLDDPNSEISQLLRQKPTYRYKLALGTKPKLYRVPFKYGEVSQ